jgi:hypothetical protein
MNNATSGYKLADDAPFAVLDETEGVLLRLSPGHYYSVNAIGTFILEWLGEGASPGELARALVERHDVGQEAALGHGQEAALGHVARLLEKLEAMRLITPASH